MSGLSLAIFWDTRLVLFFILMATALLFGCLLLLRRANHIASERKHALGRLQCSEERLSRVLEGSNEGYWDWDLVTNDLFLSDQVFKILDLPKQEGTLCFSFFTELIASSDRAHVRAEIDRSIQEGIPLREQFQMRQGGGGLMIDCVMRGKPYFDSQGQAVRLAGMLSDVTDEKKLQAALQASEARFRQLAESNLIGIVFWNIYGKIYDANDVFLVLLGYSRPEMESGKLNWRDITLPADQLAHAEAVQKAIAGQAIVPYETQYIHRDGHKVDVLVGFAMLQGYRDQGFAFVLDISDRKAAEAVLRESAQRFRYMAESMPQKVWTALPDGEMDYMNRNWMTYSGLTWEELKAMGWVCMLHEDEYQMTLDIWNEALQSGQAAQVEHRLRRYDGEYRWHLSRGAPMRDEVGKLVMWIGTSTDIDDVKQAQRALQESENRFRAMADASPTMIWVMEPNMDISYCNRILLEYLGITKEEIKATGWHPYIFPEDLPYTLEMTTIAFENQEQYKLELRVRRADGQYRWLFCINAPRWDAEGNFVGYIGSGIDIHDRKTAEAALYESEERFRTLADQAPIMIWLTDSQGEVLYNNKFWYEFSGLTQASDCADLLDLIAPEDREYVLQGVQQTNRDRVFYEHQYRMRRFDGEYRWIQATGVPRYAAEGTFCGYVGTYLDITDQKRATEDLEELVRQRTLALQKNSSLLNLIIDNVPVMIFLKDAAHLRFELFNRAGWNITGWSQEEMLGKNDYDLFPKEQADFFTSKDRETLDNKMMVNVPEEPIQTKNGEMKVLHTRKVPIMDEQGFPAYLLGVSEDMTEYKQTQAQIQALNEQLQEQIRSLNVVNKELEAFSYSVSHDLRAPLRTIDGFSQAILEDYADRLDEDGQRYLSRIREGSQQMAQLIDDMLNLSRLTRGDMNKASVNISEMARAIAQDLKRQESGRSVEFRIQDGMIVHADKRLIQAVLENLLGNSWKFTAHHPDALIEFGAIEKDGKPVYFVKDNGAGFDMAYADKLFGVFQRLHDVSEFQGTGVGLASVQRIIHRHGGDIWAEGAVNKGATFYFTL